MERRVSTSQVQNESHFSYKGERKKGWPMFQWEGGIVYLTNRRRGGLLCEGACLSVKRSAGVVKVALVLKRRDVSNVKTNIH